MSWQDMAQLSRVSTRHRQIYSFLLENFEKTLLRERNARWQKKFDMLPEQILMSGSEVVDLITPATLRQSLMNGSTSETWSSSGCETTYAIPESQWDVVLHDPAPLHG